LRYVGLYTPALTILPIVHDIGALAKGNDLLLLAKIYNEYGTIIRNACRPGEAVTILQTSIEVRENAVRDKVVTERESELAVAYMDMGSLELQRGNLPTSASWHERGIRFRETYMPEEKVLLPLALINYSWCLWKQMELSRAENYLLTALRLIEEHIVNVDTRRRWQVQYMSC
jgi:tetratricopeptide (TPR) repeat protein